MPVYLKKTKKNWPTGALFFLKRFTELKNKGIYEPQCNKVMEVKYVKIDLKSAIAIVAIFFLNGIGQSQTAMNHMDDSSKAEVLKNNTPADYAPVTISKNQTELSSCPVNSECSSLHFPCIKCNYTTSCIYGKDINITCEANSNVACTGDRHFTKVMNCRYCFQTELWQYLCVQKGNCNSIDHYYKTNCTVYDDVICLGSRTFLKNIKCNWTQGYKWSTAVIISLTLGGFGADRFYLGHWQEGIGKLFSFGGLGVWTIIDVLLISLHYLGPADGSLYI